MRLRDEQGMMAIGVALMLIVVLPLFGGVLWQYSMAELRRVEKTEQDMRALFLARAGAEMVMGAWQRGANSEDRPFGEMDPIYFDLDTESFVTAQPVDYLGPIEVEVRQEATTEEGEYLVTVIEATATVGSTRRTVRLVAYPHRYGHDPSLLWYDNVVHVGAISASTYVDPEELVMMRTEPSTNPIYLGSTVLSSRESSPSRSIKFTASDLVFDSPLKLVRNAATVENSEKGNFSVTLDAHRIFLAGLEIAYLPEDQALVKYASRNYNVVLRLPTFNEQKLGDQGHEIIDRIDHGTVLEGAWYGQVYFDDSSVICRSYEWYQQYWWWPFLKVRERTSATKDLNLSGKAFYFKEDTITEPNRVLDPSNIQSYLTNNPGKTVEDYFDKAADDGLLVPIKDEYQIKREDLEGLRPFFWEQ